MTVILALLSTLTILIAIPLFLFNWTNIANGLEENRKELEDLKAKSEEFDSLPPTRYLTPDMAIRYAELKAASELYDSKAASGCVYAASGCFLYLLSLAGALILKGMQLVVMIMALSMAIGTPLYGYVSLAIWALLFVYGFASVIIISKKTEKNKEGAESSKPSKTNWIEKAVGLIPSLYALYVLLVIIGLLA